ncbi:sn-glycerol-3-phosphate ABC transporter ATP-binding protein UgpC [Haloferax sp. AB510]|uniref:ABC transporter ATP-binding protein n=1 Tax=Haloferax sp. AB510 TaxID=2934172 RepID=UPI00209C363B|nr:sn-glycerol-3-phosphate ABC transporter ATP-binding protein UgpC [Haloferax sp. AB510]MCO8265563.1 sn-glycerol-3-phosphate ABC transporter ATP-binding protein UgpC [Haloferax sp. AB510]
MAHVELNELVKNFNDVTAVDGISLDIPDESFTVLVGPSGCGKTTTLRLVAGLERASDGEIRIGDEVVNDRRAYERDIAMVFQNYALYPHKTVRGNMRFGLEQHDTPEDVITERVSEAAKLLQIEELLDRKPSELSGGQQQRVALGRAIVRDPAVFLMDEPLSNLDAKLRVQMRAELNKLHEELSTTTVYVTHDQVEAMTLADQIAVMDGGEIQQVGEPTHVYTNPRNMFVAGFLGSPSMNFIEGTLNTSSSGKFELDLGGETHDVPDEFAADLEDYVGERVVLGIRPENIALNQDGVPANVHPATVDVVEPQGEKTVLEVTLGTGQSVKAAVAPDSAVEMGDSVNLRFDRDSLQYFDPQTGASLTYDSKPEQKAIV